MLSKYESNTQSPTLETLIDLAVIFNVSLDYLAGISEKSAVSLEGLSGEQRKIISLSQIFRTCNAISKCKELSFAPGSSAHAVSISRGIISTMRKKHYILCKEDFIESITYSHSRYKPEKMSRETDVTSSAASGAAQKP